ncbi:MAG: DUF2804 domain-containing protein [Oscillospiraceae bacterium]
MQNEIRETAPLLDADGKLTHRGFSKKMLLKYDRRAIGANGLRIKEWDYYIVANGDFAVALTIADNSYMGLHSVSLLDFKKPWEQTTSVMTFMPNGKTNLPSTSKSGDTVFKNDKIDISFCTANGKRHLRCRMEKFKDKKPFECDLMLDDASEESMVIATPFEKKETAFYYNQKINCMPAAGTARFDGKIYVFEKGSSFGTLDWGRGVWTYSNTWYWGSASGIVEGERFGFNIGYGFGDTSAASENMLFYGGAAHKLEDVSFDIPMSGGHEDYMRTWTFSSSDGRFEMRFEPVLDRASCTSAILIKSDQHQVFGRFSGKAVLDGGRVLEVKNLMGFAEKVMNKW